MNVFDRIDVLYLANNLSMVQLRHEIHTAEVKASVAGAYRDTEFQTADDLFPWNDYAGACREAIELKRTLQPKSTTKPGHIDIESLKTHANILSIIESYGIHLRKAGRNFKALCPFHKEKTSSFTVNPDKQTWHCFGCNTGGGKSQIASMIFQRPRLPNIYPVLMVNLSLIFQI